MNPRSLAKRLRDLARASRRDASRDVRYRREGDFDRLEQLVQELRADVAALGARIRNVQSLTARVYERTFSWPDELERIRGDPAYERAWDDPDPLITVRIATWNNAKTLCERALPSLLAQTHTNWEALVVGDALTDDTEERIAAIRDSRIRFWNLPFRGPYPDDPIDFWHVAGTAPANEALRAARGLWIGTLDHDDEFDPDHLARLLAHARATRAEFVYGRMRTRDAETGTPLLHEVGVWPPRLHRFSIHASLYHGLLRRFEYDSNAYLAGEPGDFNLVRRMWDAGVRFSFLDRIVGTYYLRPKDDASQRTIEALVAEARAAEPPAASPPPA